MRQAQIKVSERIFSQSALAFMVTAVFFLFISAFSPRSEAIKIHYFDVGQGDSALISTPANQTILIDGGPSNITVERLDETMPYYNRELDAIILTHPHADHLVGLLKVIEVYKVKQFYFTGVVHTTPEYIELLENIKEKGIAVKAVEAGDQIDFGNDIKLDFLFPLGNLSGKRVENLNNSSIVNVLSWGQKKAIFTGDIEKEAQQELLKRNFDLKADILKYPHHGSKDASDESFIEAINPKYAVLSVGKDNKFGHPSQTALNLLKNVTVYRTDYDGDLIFEMTRTNVSPKN